MARFEKIKKRQSIKKRYRELLALFQNAKPLIDAMKKLEDTWQNGFQHGYAACAKEMEEKAKAAANVQPEPAVAVTDPLPVEVQTGPVERGGFAGDQQQ